jgi:class 3 adenylate cyclase
MAELDAEKRARLPNSAFAYVDSTGRRRLPIHDEAHVRNALARFSRTTFEDEAARERARQKLLRAARKYGIVPIGFFAGQLSSQRREADAGRLVIDLERIGDPGALEDLLRDLLRDPTLLVLQWSESAEVYLDRAGQPQGVPVDGDGRVATLLERQGRPMTAIVHDPRVLKERNLVNTVTAAVRMALENERLLNEAEVRVADARNLPDGSVTFFLTDIEDSTGLLRRFGDRYPALLNDVRRIIRSVVRRAGGREIDARADEYFAVFVDAGAALRAALEVDRRLGTRRWPDKAAVRVRIGIHTGTPTLTDTGYVGLAVHTAARVSAAGHGGQILLSAAAREAIGATPPEGVSVRSLGRYRLRGLAGLEELYQAAAAGRPDPFPPPRVAVALETAEAES